MRSTLRLHLVIIKTPQNVHKICFCVIDLEIASMDMPLHSCPMNHLVEFPLPNNLVSQNADIHGS